MPSTAFHGHASVWHVIAQRNDVQWRYSNNDVVATAMQQLRDDCVGGGGGGVWRKQRAPKAQSVQRASLLVKNKNSKNVVPKSHTHIHTHTHTHPFNGPLSGTTRWAGTRKVKPIWILLEQETVSSNGISWAICKSAPRSRQITTPVPHHSVFYRPDAAQPTASKH